MAELSADEEPLGVEVSSDRGVTVVRLTGEVDIDTCGALVEALAPVFDHGAGHLVIFELAQTTFLDSAGLAVLLRAAQDGRSVLIRKPSEAVRLVLDATGLSETLPVEP